MDFEWDRRKTESNLRKHGISFAETGTNLVLLEPEVAKAFPNDKAVNEALKLVMKLKQVQENAAEYSTKR